jgi:uncharacterized membrane protein
MIFGQSRPDETEAHLYRNTVQELSFFTLALLISFGAQGCSGGSAGGQNNPPPPPVFTTIDAPGAANVAGRGTFGMSINAAGDVVGAFTDASDLVHGFIRTSSGVITTVDAPGAGATPPEGTVVRAINTSGAVAGYYDGPNINEHSYIRTSDGTLTEFDPPTTLGSGALCINDNGAVAGGSFDLSGHHGFVRDADGSFSVIDPTGTPSTTETVFTSQINSGGAVAGYYTDATLVFHGFLRDGSGVITILDAPGAGTTANTGTQISDINSHGVMVGGIAVGIVNGVNTTHSFMLSADGTYTFFEPTQAVSSFAEGINDNGVVVGEYRDTALIRHGYIRQPDGTIISFDDPNAAQLPVSAAILGTEPRRINLSGQIVGSYSDSAGVTHAFIKH